MYFQNKNMLTQHATLYRRQLFKLSASIGTNQKKPFKMSFLAYLDADARCDEELSKPINQLIIWRYWNSVTI